MKNILIILTINLFPLFVIAQIPNYSFEAWTNHGLYDDPDYWSSMNSATATFGQFTCEIGSPGNPGTSYLKLTTRDIPGLGVVPGIAVCGVLNTTTFQPVSGFSYMGRPESLIGKWQFMANGDDQGYISVLLTSWNQVKHLRDTIAFISQPLKGMQMSWKNFTIPLNYSLGSYPDSAIVFTSASNANGTIAANYSYLYLDSLAFYGNVEGLKQIIDENSFSIYPNPAKESIVVKLNKPSQNPLMVEILNPLGQLLFSEKVEHCVNPIPVEINWLPNGIYIVRINSCDKISSLRFVHIN